MPRPLTLTPEFNDEKDRTENGRNQERKEEEKGR